jgi:hypothetical protein
MNCKQLFFLAILMLSFSINAQVKVFAFSHFQTRNSVQQWGKYESSGQQLVHFSPEEIDLRVDKKYHLTILSKTDLPNNGVIYLCNDEKSNPVTVTLIDNSKMFLYSKTKRYQINFDPMNNRADVADTD